MSGAVTAAAALDVERMHGAAGEHRERVLDREHSLRPSVWTASCTSYASATVERGGELPGPAPTSSWIFSPAPPARSACSTGSGRDEERARQQREA